MPHPWLAINAGDLRIEREQLADEGKDATSLETLFEELLECDPERDPETQRQARQLLKDTYALPVREAFPFSEPSGIAEIQAARPDGPRRYPVPDDEALRDRLHGAWLGRCCGCLLGKPVEGRRRHEIQGLLKATGNYPLAGYISANAPAAILEENNIDPENCFIENVDSMPEDDDTNYTGLNLALMEEHGPEFTPDHAADFWMQHLPILHTCTAERVAYRNFAMSIRPPDSAAYCNPYREWIGAQIRADAFGYVCAADPERAAGLAWRDAAISHVKNGIYGEMWAAAMIAAAAVEGDVRKVIEAGLTEIPADCRLSAAIQEVFTWREKGLKEEQVIEAIHQRWDEANSHHWCHTISNAQIVAFALLWGDSDFGKTICLAVESAFDTDCNGATAGSILGMMLGAAAMPEKWTAPLNDTLITGVAGFHRVRISEMADRTLAVCRKFTSVSD